MSKLRAAFERAMRNEAQLMGILFGILTLGQAAQSFALPPEPEQTLQIVKKGYAYSVYLNGKPAGEPLVSRAPAYAGTLHIGCQTREDGSPFRFSGAKILEFSVE